MPILRQIQKKIYSNQVITTMVKKKSATQYYFSGLNLRHCNTSPTPMLIQKSACMYMGLYCLDPGLFQRARREVSTMLTFTVSIKINILVTSQRGTGQHPPQESAAVWCKLADAPDPSSFTGSQVVCPHRQEILMPTQSATKACSSSHYRPGFLPWPTKKDQRLLAKDSCWLKWLSSPFPFCCWSHLWSQRYHKVQLSSVCKLQWQKASHPTRAESTLGKEAFMWVH